MLLVAVTGPVGSGKTTLLAKLAERSPNVDGFLQRGGPRNQPGVGAESYDLQLIRAGDTLPFLLREEEGGYSAVEGTVERLHAWASAIEADVLVLDEFGRWEAEGKGHMAIWPLVAASNASIVVMSVRESALESLPKQLGKAFDVVIHTSDPEAESKLLAILDQLRDWERVGVYGAGAGGIEATIGSALHTVKFPITGLVMASTQVIVMSLAAEKLQRRERVVWVSTISAGLKALSPSGSRLGPMLAITVQGILATAMYRLFGWNRVGAFFAGAIACTWAGLQGLLIQYLLLGKNLQRAFDAVTQWVNRTFDVPTPALIACVIAVACAYAVVGGTITAWAWGRRNRFAAQLSERLTKRPEVLDRIQRKPFWKSALDLFRPSFLLPTVIVCAILFAAGSTTEDVGWILLRAFAVGLALLGAVRWLDPKGFVRWLRRRGKWGPAYAFSRLFE